MSKINWLGILFFLGGIVLVIFQSVSSMMTTDAEEVITWKGLSLTSLFGEDAFGWIEGLSWATGQNLADTVVNMQLWILMVGVGILLLIAGMVFKK